MATKLKLISKNAKYTIFEVDYETLLYVRGFNEGLVEVQLTPGIRIENFARIIEGCFSPFSNFKKQILIAFELPIETKVNGIKCMTNTLHICTATNKLHSRGWIVNCWKNMFFERV